MLVFGWLWWVTLWFAVCRNSDAQTWSPVICKKNTAIIFKISCERLKGQRNLRKVSSTNGLRKISLLSHTDAPSCMKYTIIRRRLQRLNLQWIFENEAGIKQMISFALVAAAFVKLGQSDTELRQSLLTILVTVYDTFSRLERDTGFRGSLLLFIV